MSLSFQPLQPIEVRDPRTIVSNQRDYAVLKSGSEIFWKQYTTTAVSSSSMQFSCPPPSGNIFVDRKMYIYVPVRLTMTGTPPVGQTLLQAGRDAPRAFPLSSAIDVFQATINGKSVSINMADVIHPLLHFNTGRKLKNLDYSMTPCCPDQSQNYGDLVGSIRNPLTGYGDSLDESVMGRGAFPFVIVQNPVSTGAQVTAIVDMALCEPIFLSPFYWGHHNSSAFFNVNSMDFNITFLNQAGNRMWSHDSNGGTNVITSCTATFGGNVGGPTTLSATGTVPYMFFKYITPQETQILSPDMAISYPYFDIQRFPTNQASNTGISTQTYNSNNIQLSSIPRRVYIYVRQQNQDLFNSTQVTDTYFQISNVTIQFQSKSGLLASANMEQLYEMSVKNHCNLSWTQWSGGPVQPPGTLVVNNPGSLSGIGTVGSIICIEFATDIGLPSLDAPGKLSQCMFQVQVNATNLSGNTIVPTLYVVPILEGTFTIQGLGRADQNIGVITSKDILDARSNPYVNYKDVEEVNGGNFFSGLRDFGKSLLQGLRENKTISKLLKGIPHPVAQVGAPIAEALGFGEGTRRVKRKKRVMKKTKRGGAYGGQEISRSSLKDRLQF